MKINLVSRGGKNTRYDIVLGEPFAGFPEGECIGQFYANDYGKRQANPDRQILALKIAQHLDSMER